MTMSDTSPTPPTRDGATISAVLSLGERIAATLDEDDLLSQWMAHHIAERLTVLETLQGAERATAENELVDHILRLWEHRHGAMFGEYPLDLSESVIRAVARLDPKPGDAFFGAFGFLPSPSAEETRLDTHLWIAQSLDIEVGRLIRQLVILAAESAADTEAAWVEAAREADTDPFLHIRDLLEQYGSEADVEEADPRAAGRAQIAAHAARIRELLAPLAPPGTE
ncbi:hypothetical protein J2Y46_001087 [Microbacterium sp. BE35]|uniref:hypothetical protein n=1 Tax=Microbacterium sp. BE35 TaxID=2817773 RepID=UPI002862D372|nr:hypothetical protein [Microbacterium sp. BE35]MDR7188271.1 hypothetical protein [Microbacterium sp. BE35]